MYEIYKNTPLDNFSENQVLMQMTEIYNNNTDDGFVQSHGFRSDLKDLVKESKYKWRDVKSAIELGNDLQSN